MKTGKTLTELATELERQNAAKRDFLAPVSQLELKSNGVSQLSVAANSFELTDYAHGQLAEYAGIPKKYYDVLRAQAPALLDNNVNHWLKKSAEKNEKRMIRTMDNRARAFLSDRYRAFDNYEVAEHALTALHNANCEIVSCEVTEKRFYLKAISPKVTTEIAVGDTVQAGLVISNSEIGAGSLKVEPLIYRLICTNGMIAADSSFKRNHVGKALEGMGNGAIELLSDETRRESDRVVLMQVRDIVRAVLTDEGFQKIAQKFRAAKEDRIEKDPFETVEVVQKHFALNETEKKGVLQHLLAGGDLNRFGLVNAITRTAQDLEDYDRATEFERLGGQVLELPRSQWQVIAN